MKTHDIIVIGNWKMHKTAREAVDTIELLTPLIEGCRPQVMLAVPFTSIASAVDGATMSAILIGAQNMHDAREGAFTGEISALMLKEAGARFVILGHSERRHIFGESDDWIHRKVLRALQDDLPPVLCVGETEKEKDAGQTDKILERQIVSALHDVPELDAAKVMIAYEPVWAIGTGKTATPPMVQAAHSHCRQIVHKLFGKAFSEKMNILYGGSVKSANVAEIASQKDIDGVLVGGASLDPVEFAAIIKNVEGQ
jgi:triosephosphate isomerase